MFDKISSLQAAKIICLFSICLFPSTRLLSADVPPSSALLLVQHSREDYVKAMQNVKASPDVVVLDYFNRLETNWTASIIDFSNHTNVCIREMNTDLQFYFFERKDFKTQTIDFILDPVCPSRVLWQDGMTNLARADLNIRIAWFRLFEKLNPQAVVDADPRLISVGTLGKYLSDISNNKYLSGVITVDDLDLIFRCFDLLPDFTEANLQKLVEVHESRYPGIGHFAHLDDGRNRLQAYSDVFALLSPPDYQSLHMFSMHLLDERPDLFESRMFALKIWIDNELDSMASTLELAKLVKQGGNKLIFNYKNILSNCLQGIKDLEVGHAIEPDRVGAKRISASELLLVEELNKYVEFNGQRFDINYLSKSREIIAHWGGTNEETVNAIISINNNANLELPIAEFASYAKLSPNNRFKANLDLICARLEGLQDLANRMGAQK